MSVLIDQADDYLDNSPDPEGEALNLLHYLMGRFGWAGTVLTREDVETFIGRDITTQEWHDVQQTHVWGDAASTWNEVGTTWDTVAEAISEAGLETETE